LRDGAARRSPAGVGTVGQTTFAQAGWLVPSPNDNPWRIDYGKIMSVVYGRATACLTGSTTKLCACAYALVNDSATPTSDGDSRHTTRMDTAMDERRRACTHVHVRLRQPLDALAHRCDETFDGKDPKAKGTHTHTHTHTFLKFRASSNFV